MLLPATSNYLETAAGGGEVGVGAANVIIARSAALLLVGGAAGCTAHHCNTAAAAQLQLPAAQLQLAWARPWLVRARRARPAAPTIASLPIPSPADGWENSTFFPFMF